MKPSVKVSLIIAAIATVGIGGIAKMVSASSPNPSLMAVAQQKVEPRTNEATEGAELQPLAKISASQAQQTAEEAAQGNKASGVKLENEDGNLIYAVNIGQKEVTVDAGNGQILYTEDTAKKGSEVEGSHPRSSIQVAESEKGETNDDGK